MEEKLNQIIELIKTSNQEITSLEEKVDLKMKELEEMINKINVKIKKLEEMINKINERINKLENKINKLELEINHLDEKFEAKYNQIIKDISFELRETGDVMYQAMDRKDNKSKDEIKHYMQNKEEQKLNLIKSTVNNLIKLNDQNLHQTV